jgi:hypothetical protein
VFPSGMFLPIHEDAPEGDNTNATREIRTDWSQETISMPYAVKIVRYLDSRYLSQSRESKGSQSKAKCGRLEQLVPFFNLRSFSEVLAYIMKFYDTNQFSCSISPTSFLPNLHWL